MKQQQTNKQNEDDENHDNVLQFERKADTATFQFHYSSHGVSQIGRKFVLFIILENEALFQ